METTQSVAELVAVARGNAKAYENRISAVLHLDDGGQKRSASQVEELRAATIALELEAVDIFSLFEARMQHHFKRGPFSRKLTSLLLSSGHADLAERVHQYYLVINVLKHGKGASYRELLNTPDFPLVVMSGKDTISDNAQASVGLVDISVPGFFGELTETIMEASQFLEKR